MLLSALFFLGGIVLVQQWSQLPDFALFLLITLVFTAIYIVSFRFTHHHYLRSGLKALLLFVAGMSWAIFFAHQALQHRLPESLASKTILLQGEIIGIPVNEKRVKRFYLSVQHFEPLGSSRGASSSGLLSTRATQAITQVKYSPRKIRLSWYNSKKLKAKDIHAGERWQFLVRLKPPHGFFNPGGFDYEGWLFQQGVDASGYVTKAAAGSGWRNQRLAGAVITSIDSYRQKISQSIGRWLAPDSALISHKTLTLSAMTGLVTALAVGERVAIQPQQWQDLLHTGTNHLMAISGLHIGLAYLFGYVLGRWLVAMLVPLTWLHHVPAQHMGIMLGVIIAIMYALLAGLSIPTQRALIMLASFAVAALLRRHFRPVDGLGLALILVLIWDPLSVLSPGFWFSFIAVAAIFYAFTDNPLQLQSEASASNRYLCFSRLYFNRIGRKIALSVWLQFIITLALFPLSLYMFQQSSLLAPLANLILVPYVSFLVVPFILLALFFFPFFPLVSELCIQLAAGLLQWIWPFIHALANLPFAYMTVGNIAVWQLAAAIAGIIVVLIPRRYFTLKRHKLPLSVSVNWRVALSRTALAAVLFAPIITTSVSSKTSTSIATGAFKLTVLDVGQGLSGVIQTRHHTLVFDAGAKLGRKLDAGQSVVVPYLRANGIGMLDILVVSHGDADHIGGAASILAAYPGTELIGQDLQSLHSFNKIACKQGQHWRWDGVTFRFLNPKAVALLTAAVTKEKFTGKKRNNHSCVLRVSSVAGSVLFTGDIEKDTEKRLLNAKGITLSADVLVVPHHGSKTSSTTDFINAVHPEIAIISVGYRNRYRLPARKIRKRYQQRNIQLFETGYDGAVSMKFVPGIGLMDLDAYRLSHHHYWNRVL